MLTLKQLLTSAHCETILGFIEKFHWHSEINMWVSGNSDWLFCAIVGLYQSKLFQHVLDPQALCGWTWTMPTGRPPSQLSQWPSRCTSTLARPVAKTRTTPYHVSTSIQQSSNCKQNFKVKHFQKLYTHIKLGISKFEYFPNLFWTQIIIQNKFFKHIWNTYQINQT